MYLHGIAIKPIKRGPMICVPYCAVTVEAGLEGDCRGKGGLRGRRQITLLSHEQWGEALAVLGRSDNWWTRRANLCIGEHRFGPGDVGKRIIFEHGGPRVVLEITGETAPCERMNQEIPGLRSALAPDWRGGITCRVIEGGVVVVGHDASIVQVEVT